MAESRRRSKVKVFVHNTTYARNSFPLQPSLFSEALINPNHDWMCTPSVGIALVAGSCVLVRVDPSKELDVLWGNQAVAKVTDPMRNELTDAILYSEQGSRLMVATIMPTTDDSHHFAIRFSEVR